MTSDNNNSETQAASTTPAIITMRSGTTETNPHRELQHAVVSLVTGDGEGVAVRVDPSDIRVLTRTNATADDCVESLQALGLPVTRLNGGESSYSVGDGLLDLMEYAVWYAAETDESEYPFAGERMPDIPDVTTGQRTKPLTATFGRRADGISQVLEVLYGVPASIATGIGTKAVLSASNPEEVIAASLGEHSPEGVDGSDAGRIDVAGAEPALHTFLADVIALAKELPHRTIENAVNTACTRLQVDGLCASARREVDAVRAAAANTGGDVDTPLCAIPAIRQVRDRYASSFEGQAGISVGTVHNAKGDEERVVILPDLTPEHLWHEIDSDADLTRLIRGLTGLGQPTVQSIEQRKRNNQRRVGYVGITRPRDTLILIGQPDTETRSNTPSVDVDSYLPESIERVKSRPEFDFWSELMANLPASHVDWTLPDPANPTSPTPPHAFIDGTDAESTGDDSQQTVSETIAQAKARMQTLTDELDGPRHVLPLVERRDTTDPDAPVWLQRTHAPVSRSYSHTAVSVAKICERLAVLSRIVSAPHLSIANSGASNPTIPQSNADGEDGSRAATPSQASIGTVVHETADRLLGTDATKDDWYDVCEEIAVSEGDSDLAAAARPYVDSLLESEATDWDVLATELEFQVPVDDRTVTGAIDAVIDTGDGIAARDFKTGTRSPDPDQLWMYTYALARDPDLPSSLSDRDVATPAFLTLSPEGASLDPLEPELDAEITLVEAAEARVEELVAAFATAEYGSVTPGPHCVNCPYSYLGCGDPYFESVGDTTDDSNPDDSTTNGGRQE